MQLRCPTESILGSLVSLSDTFVFFLASSLVMHFSKHAQDRPSYVYILLTFQTSKAARNMRECDALLFPGQISNNSCNQICHRIPQKSLGSVLEVSYVFAPPSQLSPRLGTHTGVRCTGIDGAFRRSPTTWRVRSPGSSPG